MLRFRAGWAALPFAALGVSGCANLETVAASCGNGVVEAGEDCDQLDATTDKNACGQASSAGPCQFACTYGGSPHCPDAFACGVDGICRKPVATTWLGSLPVPQAPAHDLLVGDFDGDHVSDAVAVTTSTLGLHWFETTRTSTDSVSVFAAGGNPAIGLLTGVSGGDTFYPPSVTLDLSQGLGVFTGWTDRTLTPASYASISIAGSRFHATPFVWNKTIVQGTPHSETDFFVYDAMGVSVFQPPAKNTVLAAFVLGETPSGTGAVARFDGSQQCGQLAMAINDKQNQGHVRVWSPCALIPLMAQIDLPAGVAVNTAADPLHLTDVDFDGNADLVISGADNRLYVAFSDGGGKFAGTPAGPFTTTPTAFGPFPMIASDLTPLPSSMPGGAALAVGDLNGDCIIDFVDSANIYVSYGVTPPPGPCKPSGPPTPHLYVSYTRPQGSHLWTEAHIADMNQDGWPDVVVASDHPGITLYRGTGMTVFNPLDIPTSTPAKALAIGDVDGDLVPDLIYAEIGPPTSADPTLTQDTVYVAYGTTSGPLTAPVSIGQIDGVAEIIPSKEESIYADIIENPFVAAYNTSGGTDVYLFAGDGNRQVVAPYFLLQSMATTVDAPKRTAVGSFTGSTVKGTPVGDIAVYAKPTFCTKASASTMAVCANSDLWLLPTLGDAVLDVPTKLMPAALTATYQTADDALLANLGPAPAGGHDQLVMAAWAGKKIGTALVSAAASGGVFVLGKEVDLPLFDLSGLGNGDGQMLTANVDGTGPLDVVLASAASGVQVLLWDGTTLAPQTLLPYAEVLTTCGIASTAGMPSLRVAAFSPDTASKKQALVAVTPTATVLLTFDGGTLKPSCLRADAKGVVTPGKSTGANVGGLSVAVGDFDGDAIDDILVSQPTGLVVYYGESLRSGGNLPPELSYAKGTSQ